MGRRMLPAFKTRIDQAICRIESLEPRRLLSVGVLSPDLVVSPDRWGGGGWGGGGYGGGGYGGGGYGGGGTNGGSTTQYYVPPNGYSPSQIETAYGFNQITINGSVATGAGETIAIVDAYNDPNISSDLTTFDNEFDLPAPPSFSQVSQTGGSTSSISTDDGWALETSLDVEWAHAIAPGADILLVEAKNDNTNSLLSAVNYARSAPDVAAVSMSWGGSEFSNQKQYDSYFTTPAGHTGVTFVAAAGDSPGAEWPASSPNVISVGGTTLETTNSTGTYGSETAWSDTGGGLSEVVKEPSYQETAQTSGARATPDVAYDADPNTGFQVYDSVSYEGVKGWQEIGGTSAGTPQWAALIAITDQVRASEDQPALNGPTTTLPLLYGSYSAPNTSGYDTYATIFHDITSGGGFFFSSGAIPGYDLLTGLGSPDAPNIVSVLTSKPVTASLVRAVKTTTPSIAKPHTPIGMFGNSTTVQPVGLVGNNPPVAVPSPAFIVQRVVQNQLQQTSDGSGTTMFSSPTNPGNGIELGGDPIISHSVLTDEQSASPTAVGLFSQTALVATYNVTLAESALDAVAIDARAGVRAAAASSHVVLELAQLDAGIFADSLRAFVHESANLEAGIAKGRGLANPIAMAAAAILADAVLVGVWYMNRSRLRAKSPVLAAPGQEV